MPEVGVPRQRLGVGVPRCFDDVELNQRGSFGASSATFELIVTVAVRIVDANVFVSAALQRGASHFIVTSWLAGEAEFQLVMCPEQLAEVREVLTARPRLRKWITLEDATQFVDTIATLVDLVDDPMQVRAETRDQDDDHLVALARGQTST